MDSDSKKESSIPVDTPFAYGESLGQLDWPWLVEQIQKRLRTIPAREGCADLLWVPNRDAAVQTMQEVEETRALLAAGHSFPLGDPPDIRPLQPRIYKGAILGPEELLDIASWMETTEALRKFLVIRRQQAPLLYRYAETAPSFSHLIYDIRSCVDEKGEVRDEASPELATLRKKAKKVHKEIHQRLHTYLTERDFESLLQDKFYTIKEDRYVLPIKTNQRGFVDGIVLGSSNSGATLFIEPREVVELNNTYKLAQLESQREINRILLGICDHLRQDASEMEKGHTFLTRLDIFQARGEFSNALEAKVPTLSRDEGIRLHQARHPFLFLTKGSVVANDILITPPHRTSLITGPNAGGKTVILKTVGLLSLMVRAGFALPVGEGSNLPFFDRIFSDIGDSQSLEESRSTFSGHVQRIVDFLSSVEDTSLALLDEIMIGTDPEEGSSLAQAVLEYLADTGAFTLATTHYLALKTLATRQSSIQNTALGFDPHTLEPTYRLTPGVPGTSNALYIAGHLGLPARILARARSLRGETGVDIEGLLVQIQTAKKETEEERDHWKKASEEAEAIRQALRQELGEVERRERELKRKYKDKLDEAFREALRELERLRRQQARSGDAPSRAAASKPIREYRDALLSEEGLFHEPPPVPEAGSEVDWSEVRCGDTVYLPELQADARVLNLPDRKGTVVVEARGFRMQVEADRAWKPAVQKRIFRNDDDTGRPPKKQASWGLQASENTAAEGSHRCDLRGLTVEEALDRTSKLLDKGFREQAPRVVLIHGLGKGILRDAIRQSLSQVPYPISFRAGQRAEGGDGVTVVEFEPAGFPNR
jgi:DNA mismatch repair protein MutS2